MAGRGVGLLGQIHRLWDVGTFAGLTDAQLLARYASGPEDGAELAFEALVERHGPMVFRVCRGVLRDEHSAEDALQATFLVLARKARSVWVKNSLASWLHGVAHRVASRARSDAARRRQHEQQLAQARRPAFETPADRSRTEAWAILSEEIARLPDRYRAPVVLCYLEAMSYKAAAASLGVTEDAVRGRLARARQRLRKSLARRGVEVPAVNAAARPAIPIVVVRHELVQATARSAVNLSVRGASGLGAISRSAIFLYERTCRTMMLTKLKAVAAALVLGSVAAGAFVSAQPPGGARPEASEPPTKSGRPVKAVAAQGGNMIVDWIPLGSQSGKRVITVDPRRHGIHAAPISVKRDDRPNDGAVRIDLEHGRYYKITASGQAFTSEQTGHDADPFPGVVVLYPTDEEDCWANRQIVLAPGKSIAFRSPWLIDSKAELYVLAFFLDAYWPQTRRGSYTLTIEETGEPAVGEHTGKADSDASTVTIDKGLEFLSNQRREAAKDAASPARAAGAEPAAGGHVKDAPR
jgi:RNA polymerase sigma factor (sigma-70 family)